MFSKQIDILAIGDTTTDAIIRIKQAHIECNISHKNCELCMKFGDKIPYESLTVIRATGNSANVTVASARLGLNTALISNVGNDLNGQECIETLKKEKVDTKFVSVHKKMETNYHYVLWYDSERTILVKHNEFPYRLPKIANNPKWVYLSSLASNSYEYQKVIIKWLKDNPDIKLAFQPGTFQIELGLEKLKDLYLRSEIFYCNKEEAQKILNTKESDLKKLLNMMRSEGPKIVVITDGENGAYALSLKSLGIHKETSC